MISRKEFIEFQRATCKNWSWSWSFINKEEKIIIFGAWDNKKNGDDYIVLDEEWMYNSKGKKKAGYTQSFEHIRLIEEEGYQLKIFIITPCINTSGVNDAGPARIKDFSRELQIKILKKKGNNWLAVDNFSDSFLPEEVDSSKGYYEGASKKVLVNSYERNMDARLKCIEHHGCKCYICSFNFQKVYGSIGEGYIHVHHLKSLSEIREEYKLDPINDLIPICPNCHAIIHRKQNALSVEELKSHFENRF